jgi:hypothetical protein
MSLFRLDASILPGTSSSAELADLVTAGAGDATGLLRTSPPLVTVRGGGYGPGTPREGWDHSTPYLQRILGNWWQADLTVVERELTLAATTPRHGRPQEPGRPSAHRGPGRRPPHRPHLAVNT